MTLNAELVNEIHALLKQDVEHTDVLLTLLASEKEKLRTREFSSLADIIDEKERLMSAFENNTQRRFQLLTPYAQTQDLKEQFKQFLAQCPTTLIKQLEETNRTLEINMCKCKEMNIVNGQIIASSIQNNQALLNILQGRNDNAAELYTAQGKISGDKGANKYKEV